jgi:hypothetical protein
MKCLYEMLYLRVCSLKPIKSRGIEILPSSHKELGCQPKSFNWMPNLEFEGVKTKDKDSQDIYP